jgi:ribosomal 50S subunit-recycling heat shock protein
MRIDLFLKLMGIAKTRMIAKRMCEKAQVLLEGKPVKPSAEIKAGEVLEILIPEREGRIQILEIPQTNSVAKHDREKFIKKIEN